MGNGSHQRPYKCLSNFVISMRTGWCGLNQVRLCNRLVSYRCAVRLSITGHSLAHLQHAFLVTTTAVIGFGRVHSPRYDYVQFIPPLHTMNTTANDHRR